MEKIYGQLDLETISKLADIVSSRELSEITLTDGENSITIKGKKCPPPMPPMPPMQMMPPMPQLMPGAFPPAENAPQGAAPAPAEDGNVVKAPIVGTFYSSPAPGKPAFVKVGDKVNKGDVIMIIESMKLMNEVQSEFTGTVEKILVSDGQAVEFDQPVMIIK